eukprot:jgi/Tetstr1/427670/TSEL_017795.t1
MMIDAELDGVDGEAERTAKKLISERVTNERSTKKATKATGGSSTKKATKTTGSSSTKKADKAAAPEEPPKDSAEGERYTHADCALLIRLVNDADAAMARILNRTENIDKVWTFVRENFNEQCEGSARSRTYFLGVH